MHVFRGLLAFALIGAGALAGGEAAAQLRQPAARPGEQQVRPLPPYEKMFPYNAVWSLREMNGKPVPGGVDATMMIDQNNHGSGSSGCNTWSSPMAPIRGQRIAMGAIALTRKSCPPATMAFERTYLVTLHSGPAWDIEGSDLIVKTPQMTLRFRRGI